MADLFKSALGYLGSTTVTSDNEFVGQEVEINGIRLRIKKVIAEGGFAFVFVAQDTSNGKNYALKRLLGADQKACNAIREEITISKQLSGHPYIVDFVAAAAIDKTQSTTGRAEFLLLSELCTGGSLIDALRNQDGNLFSLDQVCSILFQCTKAVQHLQAQNPIIVHRDLKIENLLISEQGFLKLCDFGSCMTKTYEIDPGWSANQRGMLEDEMAQHTTPMYRPPEMLDTWNNYPINGQSDIWALGCILYYICYLKHPFEDSAKLRIVNGNYVIPPNDGKYQCLHEVIRGMLKVDPRERFTVSDILERLAAIAETNGFSMKVPLKLKCKKIDVSTPVHQPHNNGVVGERRGPPERPAAPRSPVPQRPGPPQRPTQPQRPAQPQRPGPPTDPGGMAGAAGGGGLFSSLKGYSGSIFKNIKDTSSKVMQNVSQAMTRTDLDMSHITSRVVAMSYPAEGLESAYRNHVEDVKGVLDARNAGHYVIYNVSGRQYHSLKFNAKIVEANWNGKRPPTLGSLYNMACSVYDYLAKDPKNIVVIHCMDGKASTAMLVCSFLLLVHAFNHPEQALNMFAIKRAPPGLQPSQFRYLEYIRDIVAPIPSYPHFKPVTLCSVIVHSIPLFTQRRDGIRPYVEIFQGDHRVLSTLQDYDSIKVYTPMDNKIHIPLNVHLVGDVAVYIYHARRMMGKVSGVHVAQIQFHTGFIPEEDTNMRFSLRDVDDITEPDRYASNFQITVNVLVSDVDRSPPQPPPWVGRPAANFNQNIAYATTIEMEETREKFASAHGSPASQRRDTSDYVSTAETKSKYMASHNQQPQTRAAEEEVLISDEEDEIPAPKSEHVPAPPSGPTSPVATTAPEPSREADLLNWGFSQSAAQTSMGQPAPAPDTDLLGGGMSSGGMKKDPSNFDLLSGIEGSDSSNTSQQNGTSSKSQTTTDNLFDPFNTAPSAAPTSSSTTAPDLLGQFSSNKLPQNNIPQFANFSNSGLGGGMMGGPRPPVSGTTSPVNPMAGNGGMPRTTTPQAMQQPGKPSDPFADLGNLSGLGGGWGGSKQTTPQSTPYGGTPVGGRTPVMGSPQHRPSSQPQGMMGSGLMGGWQQQQQQQQSQPRPQQPAAATTRLQQPAATARPTVSPHHQMKSPTEPNYGRNNFDAGKNSGGPNKLGQDTFGDLLGSQGFNFTSTKDSGPRTMSEMKKVEMVKTMDPDKVKIMEWTEGKKNNIRALLCSLHTVLWDGVKWNECGMHQLVQPTDIKKMYRRACLAVHPDKWSGTEHESFTKLVFMELNDAYTEFENDPTQQQMFK